MHTHERWIKDSLQHTHTSKQTCLHDIIGLDKCFLGLEQTAAYKHRFLWETGQSGSVRMFVCPHLLFQLARMDTNVKVVISKSHRRSVFHSPCVSFWSHMLNHDCTYAWRTVMYVCIVASLSPQNTVMLAGIYRDARRTYGSFHEK